MATTAKGDEMTYLIKADALGFSRVEASSVDKERQETYEADGYREVDGLEFTLAGLVSTTGAKRVNQIVLRLAQEMGESE